MRKTKKTKRATTKKKAASAVTNTALKKMTVRKIPVSQIVQNDNSRVIWKKTDTSELMLSIKKDGLLEPIGVRKLSRGRYEVVFGNRRLTAVKLLGWDMIDAHILENCKTEAEVLFLNLIENKKRAQTTLAEDGRIYKYLKEDFGMTEREIAARLDISRQAVVTALDVLEFPKDYQGKIRKFSPGRKTPEAKKGTISANAAIQVSKMRRKHQLNRKQTRTLLEFAEKSDVGASKLNVVAPLMKDGVSVNNAIKVASSLKSVDIEMLIKVTDIKKLEKKHGKAIGRILLEHLEKTFPIVIKKRGGGYLRHSANLNKKAAKVVKTATV